MSDLPNHYLMLFEDDGTGWLVDASETKRIATAVQNYLKTGESVLVPMDLIDGSRLVLPSHAIKGWRHTSEATRELSNRQSREINSGYNELKPWETD